MVRRAAKNVSIVAIASRGHCDLCGSPIHLVYDNGKELAFAAGTLERPEALVPTHHYGVESKLSWGNVDPHLPASDTREIW